MESLMVKLSPILQGVNMKLFYIIVMLLRACHFCRRGSEQRQLKKQKRTSLLYFRPEKSGGESRAASPAAP